MKKLNKTELKRMRNACEELHKNDKEFKKSYNADFLIYLVVVVLIALSIRTFIFEPFQVIGPSMTPTLIDGEGTFVEKITYLVSKPERGDIIICRYPTFTLACVKRVIGLPGETVEVRDGAIYIDGEPLDEAAYWNDYIMSDMPPMTVPEKNIFVVGDNRNQSGDSRQIGPIPYENVKGKVQAVMLPIPNARWM